MWFDQLWRKEVVRGNTIMVRYAYDFVCGFEHKKDAERLLADLEERLARFGLTVHPDKTYLVEIRQYALLNRKGRGDGKPEIVCFLGKTHFFGKTQNGRFRVKRCPSHKRVNRM